MGEYKLLKLSIQARKQGLDIDPEWLKLIAAAKNMGLEIREVKTFLEHRSLISENSDISRKHASNNKTAR